MGSDSPSKYMSTSDEFPLHAHGWLRIHKDGRCERFIGTDIVPPGTDPITGVQSKDIVISLQSNVFVRIYIPKTITLLNRKLPTVIYYHGGGFVSLSAASSTYQPTLNLITAECNVVVVSVDYRLAPEYVVPIAYEDSWEAIKWVATHVTGKGPESWLNNHADLQNVFFAGDSAGANIAHNMGIRYGLERVNVINLEGLILLHPYFGGKDPIGAESGKHQHSKAFIDRMWKLANPSAIDSDDPLFNPAMDGCISSMGCLKILVCVAEKDKLRDRGLNYVEVMKNSRWNGKVEVMENKGVGHLFFFADPSCENTCTLRNRICTFINRVRSKV